MKIDKNLTLILPIDGDDGTFYVHATAISRQVFEQFFIVISRAFSEVYTGGLGVTAGPRIAALMLRKIADELGQKDEVERGLINEMKRLANVALPGENGWEHIPFSEAVARKLLNDDEISEVENALAFFSLASSMHKRDHRRAIMEGACQLWGGRITSSGFTDFLASLQTSTMADNSGKPAAPEPASAILSSVPS